MRTMRASLGVGLVLTLATLTVAFLAVTTRKVERTRLALGEVASTRWVDRHGRVLAESVGALEHRARAVTLDEVSPNLVAAIVAAEDKRFFEHRGIDWLATARAFWTNLSELRVVSGGSTLTQQLARLLLADEAQLAGLATPPRSLVQKFREAVLALRLEATFTKDELLAAFLSRAPFGRDALGVAAAAERILGVAPSTLSPAQAAYLAALPKGPSLFAGDAGHARALERQRWILQRMQALGRLTTGQLASALGESVHRHVTQGAGRGAHAIALARAELRGHGIEPRGVVQLTIDVEVQDEVARVLADEVQGVYSRGGRSGAVLVLDHAKGEVLAAVGSAFESNPLWGQFSVLQARRQPGSALKPFLYAAALEQGMTAASLAADIRRPFPDTWGVYLPDNYDDHFHGPVRFREALAQSLNVAAVDTLTRVGIEPMRSMLSRVGLASLDRRAGYYGLGVVLGSGAVELAELTNAYATLARGGLARPLTVVAGLNARAPEWTRGVQDIRVLEPRVAHLIGDILSDPEARRRQFGEHSVLTTPYWSAVKTGTSKGYHDNWTLGFSDRFTVGVWVGDPRGRPMRGVSGVEGAGGVWRRVMNELTQGHSHRPLRPDGLVERRICGVSGALVGKSCPGGRDELFVAGTEPKDDCAWHRAVRVDPLDGTLVPEGCDVAGARASVATVYPNPFDAWAIEQGQGISEKLSTRCAARDASSRGSSSPAAVSVQLLSPSMTEVFRVDHDAPRATQAVALHARVSAPAHEVTFFVDDRPVATVGAPHRVMWALERGEHRVRARIEPEGPFSPEHRVRVD